MGHITFVHGIANKPEPEVLLEQWRIALYDNDGIDLEDLDVTCSMVYWADLMYANPAPPGGVNESAELELERTTDPGDADMTWLDDVDADERAFVESVASEIGFESVSATPSEGDDPIRPGSDLEALPLPAGLKRRLMRILLRDVHHYLYDEPFSPRGWAEGAHPSGGPLPYRPGTAGRRRAWRPAPRRRAQPGHRHRL